MQKSIPTLSEVVADVGKLKGEDRRFLMDVINQNVQMLQNRHHFKLNIIVSDFAVYLSLVAILIALDKVLPLVYYITAIFAITLFLILTGKNESDAIKGQTAMYKIISERHFSYLREKRKGRK